MDLNQEQSILNSNLLVTKCNACYMRDSNIFDALETYNSRSGHTVRYSYTRKIRTALRYSVPEWNMCYIRTSYDYIWPFTFDIIIVVRIIRLKISAVDINQTCTLRRAMYFASGVPQ